MRSELLARGVFGGCSLVRIEAVLGVGAGRVPGGGVAFKTLAERRRRRRCGVRSGDEQAGRYGCSQGVVCERSLSAECGDGGLAPCKLGRGGHETGRRDFRCENTTGWGIAWPECKPCSYQDLGDVARSVVAVFQHRAIERRAAAAASIRLAATN